jgi:fatty-acyl-CoA synthase
VSKFAKSGVLVDAEPSAPFSPADLEVLPPITHGLEDISGEARITVKGVGGTMEEAALTALAASAVTVAKELRQQGLAAGAPIAAALPTSLDTIVLILAAWALRSPICLLPLRRPFTQTHTAQLSASLSLVRPGALFIANALADAFDAVAARAPIKHQVSAGMLSGAAPGGRYPHPDPNDLAILQLTSGSTGQPKAVPIAHRHLSANVNGVAKRAQISRRDVIVSWMPLYHDMGLSCVTQTIALGPQLTLLRTDEFVRNPVSWLTAISEARGSVVPATPTALRVLARMGARARRSHLDLRSLRYAWVGSEVVFESDLQAFADAFEPIGLERNALQPAYGLAEAVVAVSGGRPHVLPTVVRHEAPGAQTGSELLARTSSFSTIRAVSCGHPLEGITVEVKQENGDIGGAGEIGELHISGSSIPGRYLGQEMLLDARSVATGDLGFVREGQIFITGRSKDAIVRGGTKYAPELIERAVERALSARPGGAIAFSWLDFVKGKEKVVILLAERGITSLADATAKIIAFVGSELGLQIDDIQVIPGGRLPMTTSGKPIREIARRAYLSRIEAEEAASHDR